MSSSDKKVLFFLSIFCLALRIAFLSQKNIWYDEAFSWHLTNLSFYDIFIRTAGDIHPPLYYFILKIWNTIFGDSLISMRALSGIFSTAALYFIFKIACKALDRRDAYLASFLFVISPLNLYFSQEVRMSAVNLLLTAASTYCFMNIMRLSAEVNETHPMTSSHRMSTVLKIGYVITSLLALYTHYFSALILFSHFLFLLVLRKKLDKFVFRKIAILIILTFLLYLPWIPIMMKQLAEGQTWRGNQNVIQVLGQLFDYAKDISLGFYFRFDKPVSLWLQIPILFISGLFLYGLVIYSRLCWCSHQQNNSVKRVVGDASLNTNNGIRGDRGGFVHLILVLVIFPLAASICISFFEWIEFFRYLSIIGPFILVAGFIVFKRFPLPVKTTCFMLFISLNLYGDFLYFKSDFKNNDYRGIVQEIYSSDDSKSSDEVIYVYPFYYRWILEYYAAHSDGERLRRAEIGDYGFPFEEMTKKIDSTKPAKFWFILDYSSFDSTSFDEKLSRVKTGYEVTFEREYPVIPHRIILYRLKRMGLTEIQ